MRTLTLALFLAVAAFGADVTGRWNGSLTGRDGNTRNLDFTFKANGDTLTGSVVGPMGNSAPISEGKINGDDIAFTVVFSLNGNQLKMTYSGKVSGDEMRLKVQREGAPRATEMLLKKVTS